MANPEDTEDTSHLNMSDEDFLNSPAPEMIEVIEEEDESVSATSTEEEVDTPAEEENTEQEEESPAEEKEEQASDEAPGEAKGGEEEEDTENKVKKPIVAENVADKPTPPDTQVIDHKAEYERLLKPFKANGKDINIKNVDEAVALMQMGANYNKRMATLKPHLKIIKLLENNGLLDSDKLSFFIDLDKKDPQAITKLIKDSGINPVDLDLESVSKYAPTSRVIDDREIDLDTVLDEIQDTPTYNRVLNVVSKEWDNVSKQAVAGQPQLLKLINEHMSSGVYDIISTEVEKERMLGRLNGVSDIEAYRKIGTDIQARGGFDSLGSSQERSHNDAPAVIKPKPKVEDPTLKDKRRAAGITPTAVTTVTNKDNNPLSMSDDEFAKKYGTR